MLGSFPFVYQFLEKTNFVYPFFTFFMILYNFWSSRTLISTDYSTVQIYGNLWVTQYQTNPPHLTPDTGVAVGLCSCCFRLMLNQNNQKTMYRCNKVCLHCVMMGHGDLIPLHKKCTCTYWIIVNNHKKANARLHIELGFMWEMYSMSRKYCPILYSSLPYKMGYYLLGNTVFTIENDVYCLWPS